MPSKQWAKGSTRQWRKVRALVLERDGHRCQLKLPGCTTIANTAHHTLGRGVSGDDPAHIVAACAWCNGSTGDPRSQDPSPNVRAWWE